jgi:hypothetical protein
MFPVRFKQILFATAVLALAGCSGQGTTAMTSNSVASHAVLPAQVQSLDLTENTVTQHVGVRLTGENPKISPKYGRVLGYFNGKTSPDSEIVQLSANTTVVFNNVDTFAPHTAAFLGKANRHTAPWPSTFTGGTVASPAGTVISTTGFTTGTLSAGGKSLKYNSGSPGFFMFGCMFHFVLDGMRTVIIVS